MLELERGGESEVDLDAHRLDVRLAVLDRAEIDVALVSCPPTLELDPELDAAYHEGILDVVAAAGGRVVALANGVALDGFAGACVAAEALADLNALSPLLDDLERRGGLLFVHPGPPSLIDDRPAWWDAVVDYTAQMQAAWAAWLAAGAHRWPDLNVVFAILAGGAPIQLERLASRGVETRTVLHPNVYLETSSYGARALELALSMYGVGQLVYGSDLPVIDPLPTREAVEGFGENVAKALLEENPMRLLV